ncbi:helix-turn-helix domain-containing protein [Chitinophaga rhizophila]|uniref:AraC family transcriptional regulator n=1 Tax=Chitinophaga rhizophila TaxID=2866212 RepID=A0ABS7GII4_9BACT|nr:AraC family transcriptional regulator [Chitinophaga rhizophila]MBW8687502.1 AraC family transcriptional regulator [Chitinophaga rhizophila]
MQHGQHLYIRSISAQHQLLSLPGPHHPLVSVFNFEDIHFPEEVAASDLELDLYCISIKRNMPRKVKYGQKYYDFDEGVMTFTAPGQIISNVGTDHQPVGCCLIFHPDFIRRYPLGKKIKEYGFFSYAVNEALHLSEKEEATILSILQMLEQEIASPIDNFSQDVVIAHINLLLSYANRFYNRQFITRKDAGSDMLTRFEALLADYFENKLQQEMKLPDVHYFAERLYLSPNYLSDLLRGLTGRSTQQHIQDMLIEKAKELLTTTNMSVAEIAYLFGFEYPQSFNKLFKNKTNSTPLGYRQSFN